MKYNYLTFGKVEAIVNKLGGIEGVDRFLRDELVVIPSSHLVSRWKTVTLGVGPLNAEEFCKKMEELGIHHSHPEALNTKQFTVSPSPKEVDLAVLSFEDLGLKWSSYRSDVIKAGRKRGLELCSPEVALQLRLSYLNQPKDEWLRVMVDNFRGGYHDCLCDFEVANHGGKLIFQASLYGSDSRLENSHQVVFVKPRLNL